MFIKKILKPKKDSSTNVIRNFGFANTTSSGQGGVTDFSNIDSKNINTINFSAVNAEINNLTNQNITNTNSAIFEGELIGRGTVDLEDAAVKLGSNNTFDELTGSDESKLYSNDITCDYLTVNKKAHFFELVIDKIKTVGGTVIFTPADGFTIDKVTETEDNYILFWRACTEVAEGEIGDTISETGQTMSEPVSVNMWQEWDQALCQSFNLGNESDNYFNVSNRYWWRVVESASDDPEIQEINGVKYYCHWIMVYKNGTSSTTGKPLVDTNSNAPIVGDAVAMLGYRYDEIVNYTQDDVKRASAIIIAAYNTPDNQITAPSYAQYQGIVDFNLSTYRKTYFDATRGKIFGEFVVDAGGNTVNLDDYIKSFNNSNPCDISVITDYANKVDLIVLQTNGQNEIDSINNFPSNLQIIPLVNNSPAYPHAYTYNTFTLSLFGLQPYDLLNFDNSNPTQYLPSGYEGIYLKSVDYRSSKFYELAFDFIGNSQTVGSSSLGIHVDLTHDSSGNNYSYTKSIPVNSVKSVEGVDAEFYGLNTVLESVQVDATQTLQPELIYNLKYISGTNVTYPVPSTQSLRVTTYLNNGTSSTVPVQWDNANNYWRFYPNATTNYYTKTQETPPVAVPIYYKVELVDNNVVVDAKVVDVQLSPMATFSVGADLTSLIYAETTRVENESNNKYTLLRADLNGLTSTVSQTITRVTTAEGQISDINGEITDINGDITDINGDITDINGDINTINGNITTIRTDMSTIDQKADRISLHVDSVETNLDTLETNIATTGIDIENHKITLNANNVEFTGNVNIQGNMHAGLFYSSCKTVTTADETNRTFIIDPSVNNYNMYFYEMNDNNWGYHWLRMPNANYWDGLELRVYWFIRNTNASIMNNRLYVQLDVNNYMILPSNFSVSGGSSTFNSWLNNNIYSVRNSTNTVAYTMRTYPTLARSIGNASSLDSFALLPNVHYLFKAINGTWFMIDGLWTGE